LIDEDDDGFVDGTDVREENLEVKYYNERTQKWINHDLQPGDRDSVNNKVTYKTNHFTINAPTVSTFTEFQTFQTVRGIVWEFFTYGTSKFLVLCHLWNEDVRVFKWDDVDKAFEIAQTIHGVPAVVAVEYFSVGEAHYG